MTFCSLERKKCFLFILQLAQSVCPPAAVKGRTAFFCLNLSWFLLLSISQVFLFQSHSGHEQTVSARRTLICETQIFTIIWVDLKAVQRT